MSETKQLRRSKDQKMLAGVCGGLAKLAGMDVTLTRVLYVGASMFTGGGGLLLYIILIFVIPEED